MINYLNGHSYYYAWREKDASQTKQKQHITEKNPIFHMFEVLSVNKSDI